MLIGYARVSTLEQNEDLQTDALRKAGCGRIYVQNLAGLMDRFRKQGVGFRSLTENMDTSTSGGVMVFNMFAVMAQFERDLIRERTMAGLKAARARGRNGGRPYKLSDKDVAMVRQLYDSRTVTVKEIAARFNVSRSTIYKALDRQKDQSQHHSVPFA